MLGCLSLNHLLGPTDDLSLGHFDDASVKSFNGRAEQFIY